MKQRIYPCAGCIWWNSWGIGDTATHCEDGSAPDKWYQKARWGGLPECPHRSESESAVRGEEQSE